MLRNSYLIILPTYNERDNLARIIDRILRVSTAVDILVIDDSSPDGTADIARSLAAVDKRIHVIQRDSKLGLGSAYLMGFAHALTNGYRGVVTMDADNSHDPAILPQMFEALENADLVIGSRYTSGGSTNQRAARKLNSTLANLLARTVLDLPIHDCTSGFRLYSTSALSRLKLEELRSRGYSMLVELLCKIVEYPGRVVEVPIAFRDRSVGESKIGMHEVWESLRTIARLRRGRFGNIRTRVANRIYNLFPHDDSRD